MVKIDKGLTMRNRSLNIVKLLLITSLVIALSPCKAAPTSRQTPRYDKINIKGEDHKSGIFDISVEYGSDGTGWLAYSRVALPEYVTTHLAKSTNHGATWQYVGRLNQSHEDTYKVKGKKLRGTWRYETPTLLYDPTDRPERRWKLFVQKYYAKNPYGKRDKLFGDGYIVYQYASSPDGKWSNAVCLFGKRRDNCKIDLNSLHSDLRGMSFYNEIGSVTHNGIIYLSLDASATASGLGKWKRRKIILISSADHGRSWKYVGTLTDYGDANSFRYLVLTGSSLVKVKDKFYVLITPSGAKGPFKKKAHDGTFVIEFEDITRAKLKRDKRGKLIVSKKLRPYLHSGGLSDYDEQNTRGGMLFSQIDTSVKDKRAQFFKVFNTREGIQDHK